MSNPVRIDAVGGSSPVAAAGLGYRDLWARCRLLLSSGLSLTVTNSSKATTTDTTPDFD
jgi:hypothetical protein